MKMLRINIFAFSLLLLIVSFHSVYAQDDTTIAVQPDTIFAIQPDTTFAVQPDTILPVLPDTTTPVNNVTVTGNDNVTVTGTDKDKPPVYVDMSDFFAGNVSVKTSTRPKAQNGLVIFFNYSSVFFEKREIVSNVLVVLNQRYETVRFYVDVTAPDEWQPFTRRNRVYEVASGDSIFIPVRIVPKSGFSGSSRYMFSAFLYDKKEMFIGYSMFYAFTTKQMKWDLSVDEPTYYLLRDDNDIAFNVSVANQGPEPQAIQLQIRGVSKNFIITDSLKRNILRRPLTFTLGNNKDTTINLIFTETVLKRNDKMVDLENYDPYNTNEIRKYSVFFNSISPNPSETGKFQSSKKIDFIHLPNTLEANRYGNNILPLSVDMNSFNVLGIQPMTNLHLYGSGFISENSSLFYSSMLTFTSYDFSTNPFESASLYLGYYHTKFNLQFGNVSGNLLGSIQSGKGMRGEYYINNMHHVNIFYTQGPRLFYSPDYYTAGGGYSFQNKKIMASTQFGRSSDYKFGRTSDIANLNTRFNVFKNHSFGIRGGISKNTSTDTTLQLKPLGYYAGANYSGYYLKRKLTTNLSGMYFAPDFGMFSDDRITSNLFSSYLLKKWTISMRNNLYLFKNNLTSDQYDIRFGNNMVFSHYATGIGNIAPLVFYDISRTQMFDVHSRGLGFNLSSFDYNTYSRFFFNIKAGYNQAVHDEARNHFFLQTGGMMQYRIWSLMVRYNLGNFALDKNYYFSNTKSNPQNINISVRNQYALPFTGFVLQNVASYNYSTQYGSSANFMPEIYYFSKRGWRFRLFAEIALFKDNNANANYYIQGEEEDVPEPWTGNLNLGIGIRKEFGIPIPWSKNKSFSIEFQAFYDINGNGLKDRNEKEIENVVVRMGVWEILTNEDGKGSVKNIPAGSYIWKAFCLDQLEGWFPNLPDSIDLQNGGLLNVPFVRGVKVSGKVFIDREKWSAGSNIQLDLSRIKITATNHNVYTTLTDKDANFSLYLPKGKYIITIDEKVLGEKFQVLQNNFEFEVDDSFDNLFIPFYIVEKKRKVRITKFE